MGFAFKADTGDTRESPAITLIRDFLSEKARVVIYDPQVSEAQIWADLSEAMPDVALEKSMFLFSPWALLQKNVTQTDHDLLVVAVAVKAVVEIAPSALKAAQNSEAIVVATEWKEFTTIDWQDVYSTMNKPAFVFDGRMILDAEKLRQIGFKVRRVPPSY